MELVELVELVGGIELGSYEDDEHFNRCLDLNRARSLMDHLRVCCWFFVSSGRSAVW